MAERLDDEREVAEIMRRKGVDEIEARFIVALERGELESDVIEVTNAELAAERLRHA